LAQVKTIPENRPLLVDLRLKGPVCQRKANLGGSVIKNSWSQTLREFAPGKYIQYFGLIFVSKAMIVRQSTLGPVF